MPKREETKHTSHWKRFYASRKVLQYFKWKNKNKSATLFWQTTFFSFNISCNSQSTSFPRRSEGFGCLRAMKGRDRKFNQVYFAAGSGMLGQKGLIFKAFAWASEKIPMNRERPGFNNPLLAWGRFGWNKFTTYILVENNFGNKGYLPQKDHSVFCVFQDLSWYCKW